ncbi:MAG: hypothetical protein IKW11_06705 [Bacteroidales bacterium]|nr:hypothetical protein [Bacteroidales bacterium]
MRSLINSIKVATVLWAVTAFSLSAQDFSSKWMFGKGYNSKTNATWESEHFVKATESGEGIMKAVDAAGNDLASYKVLKGRAAAGPFKAGDCFLFEVPAEKAKKGTYVSFDATLSAEPGAPMDWVVEWKDGDKWVTGRKYTCYGPAIGKSYQYTTIHQTYRLKNAPEGEMVKVRLRALEGKVIPGEGDTENPGLAMFVTTTYVGAYVMDFGVTPPKDTTKVLCIGNSFTYYLSCPQMLKELAWREGHYIDMAASLKGGWSMKDHLSFPTTDDEINRGGYDVVILQDQSQAVAQIGSDKKQYADKLANLVAMADKVRTTSEDCRVLIECTWAYAGKKNGGFSNVTEFYHNAGKGIKIVAKAAKADVSPIKDAFRMANIERPDILLFAEDGYHQSVYGSYLKSCVNYLVLFGEPFGKKPSDCGLDPKRAAALRAIAEAVVLGEKFGR